MLYTWIFWNFENWVIQWSFGSTNFVIFAEETQGFIQKFWKKASLLIQYLVLATDFFVVFSFC